MKSKGVCVSAKTGKVTTIDVEPTSIEPKFPEMKQKRLISDIKKSNLNSEIKAFLLRIIGEVDE